MKRERLRPAGRRLRVTSALAAGCLAVPFGAPLFAPGASAQTSGGLAGYDLATTAAALQFEINSPGLLPVGDPATGNIIAADIPLARTTVSSGPSVDALGSPLYPGDTAAHLGTAVATFGGPSLPNDPVLAEAQYPPTPSNKTTESYSSPAEQNGVFSLGAASAQSQASPTGANVDSRVGEITAGPALGPLGSLVHIQSGHVTNAIQVADSSVASTATTVVSGIDVAGVVQIASVTGTSSGASDGSNGTPKAGLEIGKVTVAGQPAYIDQSGVHLAGQGAGGAAISFANSLLQNLVTQGISLHTIAPTETSDGPDASGDSGALVISLSGQTPRIPGVAPIAPGLPPVPGAPSVSYVLNLLLGQAEASANANPFPAFPSLSDLGSPLPTGLGTGALAGTGGTGGVGLPGASPTLASPSTQTVAPSGPGASRQGALNLGRAALARVGKAVPVGLAVLVFVLAVMASGGLLGYARWQLIDGRRS